MIRAMTAYYNEHDAYAAQWLRNLITAGHIAPGVVDERDIRDVKPNELKEYTQCHFFAGVSVWSLALRRAGWSDDRPVWTGSCPCQPFSAAGRGAGVADERHLWPHWYHFITQCQPDRIFGEQVASKDGLGWLDLVQTDLEGAGYANGAVDLCAAGVGAPHIRQRLWFTAERLADSVGTGRGIIGRGRVHSTGKERAHLDDILKVSGLGDPSPTRFSEQRGDGRTPRETGGTVTRQTVKRAGTPVSRMADTELQQRPRTATGKNEAGGRQQAPAAVAGLRCDLRPGPTNGLWRDADWLFCRDGKWRPVELGTLPLANGVTNRVGQLRAYGNAINVEAAQSFIEASMQ